MNGAQTIAVARLVLTEDSFASLVERQSRFVFRVAFAVLRNAHDAEDVVQETFLKLYRNGGWGEIEDERAFLARAAWRMAVTRLSRRPCEAVMKDVESGAASPEAGAIAADWEAAIHRLIDALPEELRQPLALTGIENMTSREIATILEIPEGTVRTRLQRARQLLKQKMEGMRGGRYGR